MKRLVILLCLLGVACSPPLSSGRIAGKRSESYSFYLEIKHRYYITVTDGSNTNEIEVTEQAWNQTKTGMDWPFEVK